MVDQKDSLQRFLDAQENDYEVALSEVKNGRKQSHWMWYIFPQVQGLGYSSTAKFYAITDIKEAKNFLAHPILGTRLTAISEELLKLENHDANIIFGSPDDLKLKSSMTLFSSLAEAPRVFHLVLEKFFDGRRDQVTLQLLET